MPANVPTITTLYHVSVDVDDELWYWIGQTQQEDAFARDMVFWTLNSVDAGSDRNSNYMAWAEFHSMVDATRCEEMIGLGLKRWMQRMKEEA